MGAAVVLPVGLGSGGLVDVPVPLGALVDENKAVEADAMTVERYRVAVASTLAVVIVLLGVVDMKQWKGT